MGMYGWGDAAVTSGITTSQIGTALRGRHGSPAIEKKLPPIQKSLCIVARGNLVHPSVGFFLL
jgi:hypothetical protein